MYKTITDKTELNEVLKDNIGVLLYFSRITCNVGEALEPKIIKLLETNYPKMPFYFIDMTEHPTISAKYNVFVEPTVLVFFEAKETIRKSRVIGIQELSQAIKRLYDLAFS
jgi:thioredoxin 1